MQLRDSAAGLKYLHLRDIVHGNGMSDTFDGYAWVNTLYSKMREFLIAFS